MKLNNILTMIALAFAICLLANDTLSAQRGGGGWGRMGGNSNMGLLNSESVQKELGLSEDQIAELKELQNKSMQSMRDMFSEMQDVPREERRNMMEGLREKMTEKMEEISKEADEVLLPHQQDRLKQLTYRSSGRNQGAGGALSNEKLLDELGLSEEQKEKLAEAREEASEKLKKDYAKLVAKAEEKILESLTSAQRKKYRELVGEPYTFEDPRARWNNRQRGGDDQRGGGRNRRGGGN